MKFLDEADIRVKAGDGGAGSRHFRREKYVPLGGPDGGNGGKGGSIIIQADRNKQTLIDFKFKPHWHAEHGSSGGANRREGKSGKDLLIQVPIGTQVFTADGEFIVDLDADNKRYELCKGGIGGKGNDFFKSATNRAPEYAQPGRPGEAGIFKLSLKLVADVGIIGFPNAGKSTLISRISSARPKIADYPFTTMVPNLGVVKLGAKSFVVADIPGLIPGAHDGKGLGIQFLKHVERTKLLIHLIDPHSFQDYKLKSVLDAYQILNKELREFSEELSKREQIVVLSKLDSISDPEELEQIKQDFTNEGVKLEIISSVSGTGIQELINLMVAKLTKE